MKIKTLTLLVLSLLFFGADHINSLRIISSQCTLHLEVLESFSVANNKPHILRCRCDCDEQTAIKSLWQAKEHFKTHCENRQASETGQCHEIFQGNLISDQCPGGGFADCLIDFKAHDIYEVKLLKLKKISKYFNTFANERLELGANEKLLPYKNQVFEISGVSCEIPPGDYFLYYKNKQEPKKEILKAFQYWKYNVQLLQKKCYVTSTNNEYRNYRSSLITLKDEICNTEETLAFDYHPELPYTGERIWSNMVTNFEIVTNETMEISYYTKPDETRLRQFPTSTTKLTSSTQQMEIGLNETSTLLTTSMSSGKASNISTDSINSPAKTEMMCKGETDYLKRLINIILGTGLPTILILSLLLGCQLMTAEKKAICIKRTPEGQSGPPQQEHPLL